MPTVLVVDDDEEVRAILETILAGDGFEVLTASSAPAARTVLAERTVELMLVDIDMPGETGVELVIGLRSEPRFESVPIIFVTAYPERSRPLQATNVGAAAVIPKPFRMTDVRQAVAQVLGKGDATPA